MSGDLLLAILNWGAVLIMAVLYALARRTHEKNQAVVEEIQRLNREWRVEAVRVIAEINGAAPAPTDGGER